MKISARLLVYFLLFLLSLSFLGYMGHPDIIRTPLLNAGEIALAITAIASATGMLGEYINVSVR